MKPYQDLDFSKIESNDVRCPDEETAEKMISKIKEIKKKEIPSNWNHYLCHQKSSYRNWRTCFPKITGRIGKKR